LLEIETRLRQFARLPRRPTALFVTKSHAIPAVMTLLPQLGIVIPRDLSVICREDDPFLGYFVPAVARYSSDASAIARKLAVMLARLAHHESLKVRHDRLMPRFVAGQSIGPPPGLRGA
jgi:LacI family transcriptional regulator